MYAQIKAVNQTDPNVGSTGKSMWVGDSNFSIKMCTNAPAHLFNPPWHIEIEADMEEQFGGENSFKEIHRTLTLSLTPSDLSKLLQFLATNALPQLVPPSPAAR